MFPPLTKDENALQNRVWGLLARAYAMLEAGGAQHAPTETRILAACSVAGIAKCLADAAVMYKSIPQKPIKVDVSKEATMNVTGSYVTVSVTIEPEWHDRVVQLVEAINIAMFPVQVQCAPPTINITLRDDEDTIYLLNLVASKLLDKADQELKEANRLEQHATKTVLKNLWIHLSRILSKRSTMTDVEIREKANRYDWWLSGEEAVKLGFADVIE